MPYKVYYCYNSDTPTSEKHEFQWDNPTKIEMWDKFNPSKPIDRKTSIKLARNDKKFLFHKRVYFSIFAPYEAKIKIRGVFSNSHLKKKKIINFYPDVKKPVGYENYMRQNREFIKDLITHLEKMKIVENEKILKKKKLKLFGSRGSKFIQNDNSKFFLTQTPGEHDSRQNVRILKQPACMLTKTRARTWRLRGYRRGGIS